MMMGNIYLMLIPLTYISMVSSIKLLVLVPPSKMGLLREGTNFSLRSRVPYCFICMLPWFCGLMLFRLQLTWWTVCSHIFWDLTIPLSFYRVLLVDCPFLLSVWLNIYVHIAKSDCSKLDPKALKCIFLGYAPNQKGYKCYHPYAWKHIVSMDITFHETILLFS